MRPVEWVRVESLPLTGNGKVDRKALWKTGRAEANERRAYLPPRTLAEEVLAEIWADVLKVDRVGVDDNFFALGGDSIRSIQVRARAQQRGLDISHQDIFQYQTIRELARDGRFTQSASALAASDAPFSLISEEDRLKLEEDAVDAYPLSKLQAGMIFHSEFNRNSAVFHDLHTVHLRAPLVLDVLRRAIEKQFALHDILRTSFDLSRFGEPIQIVHRSVEVPLEVDDLRSLTPDEQARSIGQWMEAEKTRRYDWSRAPLLRFHVHRHADDSFRFTLSFHHAILDGWSAATLLTDLFQSYWLLLGGGELDVDRLDSSFRDFISLERQALASDETARYWDERLSDGAFTAIPKLAPKERSRDAARVRTVNVQISEEVSGGLRTFARSTSVPIKSVLLAAHLRVMSLLAGGPDVVTGYTSNGRPEQKDADRALGLFLNTLPFRLRLTGGTWEELVCQTFEAEREMLPHRWYPMAQIKENLGGPRFLETSFTFLHYHVYERVEESQARTGTEILEWSGFEQTNFTLLATFHIDVATSNVRLTMSFDETALSDEQIDAVCHYYSEVLARMAANPGERYDRAAPLSKEEERSLAEWSGGGESFAPERALHQIFEERAAADPGAIALSFEGERVSYGELNRRSNQVAHYLRRLGVGPDTLVGLCFEPSIEMIVALLGALKAGGAYVPLDPAYPEQRLAFMLEDARAPVLLTEERLSLNLPRHDASVVRLDADREIIARESDLNPPNLTAPDNLAYVIYTSGSTGRPKGAQVTHANVLRLFEATDKWFDFGREDVWTMFHSYAFDFSVWEIWGALLYGGRLVIAPYWVTRSPETFLDLLRAEGVTVLNQTPTAFRQLAKADESSEAQLDLKLRFVIFGGEALDLQSLQGWFERRSDRAPQLVNMYGITETTVHVTYRPVTMGDLGRAQASPVGVTIPDLQVYALDPGLNRVPIGVTGELYVGGAGLARGYLNRADLTAERFVPNPFARSAGERLYKSGDLVRFQPDGDLEYAGRIDHQVKIRGFRIELGEIESAISLHPGVREVVVVALDDDSQTKRLVAYVAPMTEGAVVAAELKAHLQRRLPDYMTPAQVVLLDKLPMTANGKVDRRKLPAPEMPGADEVDGAVAPRTPVEEVLAGIWAQALGVEKVGAEDSFFDLGGHSLLATQVISQARETFEVDLPIRTLFDNPRLAEFSRALEDACQADRKLEFPAIAPSVRDGATPLSFAQQRLWFIQQLDAASPAYNLPVAMRLKGSLDVESLERALGEIARRHEAIRTTFEVANGEPVQVIRPAEPIAIPLVDLAGLDEDRREAAARRLAGEQARAPFDLSRGPMLRASLLRLAEDEHVAVFVMSHIVTDGWSLGVLVKELTALYEAFTRGEPSPLQDLAIQYADFARWQRQWLRGETLEKMLAYWKGQLADPPRLNLPYDRPRPQFPTYRGATRPWAASAQTAQALNSLARRQRVTPFMVLLSAFQTLLSHYAGQEDVVVGTDIAGRNRAELEPLIGFFVNQLALRGDLSGDPTFGELLARARKLTLDAYAYQDLPFEKLVEAINPDRSQAAPLFQAKMTLQNAPTSRLELPGLTLSPFGASIGVARFDLFFSIVQTGEGLSGGMDFSLDLFDPATVEQMLEQFTLLLDAAVQNPSARLSELKALLGEAERKKRAEREHEIEQIRLAKLKKITRKRTPEAQPA
jgi:amino acid adenylation domain-containing protein